MRVTVCIESLEESYESLPGDLELAILRLLYQLPSEGGRG